MELCLLHNCLCILLVSSYRSNEGFDSIFQYKYMFLQNKYILALISIEYLVVYTYTSWLLNFVFVYSVVLLYVFLCVLCIIFACKKVN